MTGYYDEIMEGVMQRKAELNELYPTFEALHKHLEEERPRLEKEGWKFIDPVEFRELNFRRQLAESR
jgi:hypothetical protein